MILYWFTRFVSEHKKDLAKYGLKIKQKTFKMMILRATKKVKVSSKFLLT